MNKALKMVGIAIGGTVATMAAGKLIHLQEERLVKAREHKAKKALWSFLDCNGLTMNDVCYVSDSGYDPIYTFDGGRIDFDDLKVPEGYVLQKNILPGDGDVTYQLAERVHNDMLVSGYFRVLVHFIDELDWKPDD